MRRKLKGKRGFALSEMLVAVAILGLLATAMGAGIPVALRAYRQVTASAEASMLCATLSTAVADELRFVRNPVTSGGALSFDSPTYGSGVALGTKTVGGQDVVTLGGRQLLGQGAYTGGLSARAAASYLDGAFDVEIEVADGEGKTWARAEFTINPINVP